MGLKRFQSRLACIGNTNSLRIDYKYRLFWDIQKGNLTTSNRNLPFNEILEEIKVSKLKKGELPDSYQLLNISDQEPKKVILENLQEVEEIGSDKNPLWESDIIISKLGLPKGYVFLNDHTKYPKLIGSTELIPYKVKSQEYLPKFLAYFLIINTTLNFFEALGSGKTPSHKRVNPSDLLKTRLPFVSIKTQIDTVSRIESIEREIIHAHSRIRPDVEIINEVFASVFNWNIKEFDAWKSIRKINIGFSSFANNVDTRFSYKFHNKAGDYVKTVLQSQTFKKIKDFLLEDITLGKSISPDNYDENGTQYYLSMADIKNWHFNIEEAKRVKQSYFDENSNKKISFHDIIMARSGEGTIGKVSLINNKEAEAVYSDFTMRIRLRNYNPLFAYFYFRTDFFQFLIYTHKKGLGNNTNIFPSQLREFPILDITGIEQQKVIDKIQILISEQNGITEEIKEKKRQISEIIKSAIQKA